MYVQVPLYNKVIVRLCLDSDYNITFLGIPPALHIIMVGRLDVMLIQKQYHRARELVD